ncbi:MAG TPA: response regulator [Blastocatellia bacterium]|nr:response regulator [Blastocatellia bacterium]
MSEKVLIADDDEDARVLWTAVAQGENLSVVEALDGRQAIEILKRDADFVLIVLDVMMPFADGYEVLKYVREDARLKNLPVIISTADRTTRSLANLSFDGRTSYINKASGLDNMRRGLTNALAKR